MDNLGQNLKMLRGQRGASQKDVADMLGVSLRTYQFYEKGEYEPNIAYLCKLADYFQVSLDTLVGRDRGTKLFSIRLKTLRTEHKRKPGELAEYLGVPLRAYQYYESGGQYPDFFGLLALADYFQVSLDYLTGRSDCPQVVQPHQEQEQL